MGIVVRIYIKGTNPPCSDHRPDPYKRRFFSWNQPTFARQRYKNEISADVYVASVIIMMLLLMMMMMMMTVLCS
jgi:hypothetical protein